MNSVNLPKIDPQTSSVGAHAVHKKLRFVDEQVLIAKWTRGAQVGLVSARGRIGEGEVLEARIRG